MSTHDRFLEFLQIWPATASLLTFFAVCIFGQVLYLDLEIICHLYLHIVFTSTYAFEHAQKYLQLEPFDGTDDPTGVTQP